MVNYTNYFLTAKNSRLIHGHISSDELYTKILNHDGSTAYCCYFDLDEKLLKMEYDTGKKDEKGKPVYKYSLTPINNPNYKFTGKTFTQYEGIARAALNCISFDFDAEDIGDSLSDVNKFVSWLGIDNLVVFFSGGKGFHIMVPKNYFPLSESEHLPNQLKDLAKHLKKFFPTLDDSIYNYNRKFRVPFTKHEKSGLYKNIVNLCDDTTVEQIMLEASEPQRLNFLGDLDLNVPPLDILVQAVDESSRKSYEVEKDNAGTIDKPSPFEKYDEKVCIKKLMESRCDDVGRNNAAMRIVNDYYRTGKTQNKCEQDVSKWATSNGLPLNELTTIINNIYVRGANYNFGCQDEVKSIYCSAKCSIWKKLDADKRPVTVDMPSSEMVGGKEIDLTKNLLMDVFHCKFDEINQEFYDGCIVKQGEKDLFIYRDNHWQHVDEALTDKIKRTINRIAKGKLGIKRIESVFKMVRTYVPNSDKDMFTPTTNASAFKNGTLYLKEKVNGEFYLEFIDKHSPKDYITNIFDFDYVEDLDDQNDMFLDLCERVFEGDADKEQKINAISEMYGAALMPYFPHLFFLCGKAQSGKSTFLMILHEMLNSDDHICSVQPKDWNQFNMESMINKLVNIVSDVNTKKPIEDDVVKQIEDRMPITINRKNKSVIRAPLPSIHLFAGNDFMPSYDGSHHAMLRRWTIIRFNHIFEGKKQRNFAHICYQSNPQGVVNFALRGLKRLVDNQGYFTNFESSTSEVRTWSLESDCVGEFVECVKLGEVGELCLSEELKIKRVELYSIFNSWQEAMGQGRDILSSRKFYKSLRAIGFEETWIGSSPAFLGIASQNDSVSNSSTSSDKI